MGQINNLRKCVTVFVLLFILNSFAIIQLKAQETYTSQTDSLALVALYNTTNGSNWTHKDNWLTGPVKTWWGITTEGNYVTKIVMSSGNPRTGNKLT